MKLRSFIIAAMLLLPVLATAQETNTACLLLKPHDLLPERIKTSSDVVKQIKAQQSDTTPPYHSIRALSWQEFSLYGTPHMLAVWYDAHRGSSVSFLVHIYYHDGSRWRFYSVDRIPCPVSVTVDRKKQQFVFVAGTPIKTIQFKELQAPKREGPNNQIRNIGTNAPNPDL